MKQQETKSNVIAFPAYPKSGSNGKLREYAETIARIRSASPKVDIFVPAQKSNDRRFNAALELLSLRLRVNFLY